jgi:hypothetical protein
MVWFGWSGLVLLLSFYSTLLHAEELYALTLTAVAVISLGATGTYLKGLKPKSFCSDKLFVDNLPLGA